MKRKLLTMVLAATLTISTFGFRANADEVVTSRASLAGITPDSILYPLDKLFDEIRIIFSFTDARKAEVIISIAQERLGESEVMAERNKFEEAVLALENYIDAMERASEKLSEIIMENENNYEGDDIDEIAAHLEEQLYEEYNTAADLIEIIRDEVNEEEIQESLENIFEMQVAKREAIAAMVSARHELNAARKDYNMARVALKQAEKSGDEEAIKDAEERFAEVSAAHEIEKANFTEAFNNKQAVVKRYTGRKHIAVTEDEVASELEDSTADIENEVIDVADDVDTFILEEESTIFESSNILSNSLVTKDEASATKKSVLGKGKEIEKGRTVKEAAVPHKPKVQEIKVNENKRSNAIQKPNENRKNVENQKSKGR